MKTLPSSNEPQDSESWPTLAEQLAELRRVGVREALSRLIDGLAAWAELWTINWSRSRLRFGIHFLDYMRVRIGYALAQPLDQTFWKHCYEHAYAEWEAEGDGGNISSGSGWAMYGVDLTYRQRLMMIDGFRDLERRERENPASIGYC